MTDGRICNDYSSALSRKGVTTVFSVGNGGMSGPFRVVSREVLRTSLPPRR